VSPLLSLLAVGAVTLATILVGVFGVRRSRTTGDFYVASRRVRPWGNASAISGEYLSAASFLGIAGLLLVDGAIALWYPIGYSAGYLLLLLFVAAPLRRSGAYTLSDFTGARLESRTVRRITSVLVIVIGWLYIVPQLQGAALAVRITTGLPSWIGALFVAVVVAVIVAAGGMRSITAVQAFQYWLKLTAIAVPVGVIAALALPHLLPAPVEAFPSIAADAGGQGFRTASLLTALLLGTMGLPHVLVRFSTNPDGAAARRTTVIVLGLLALFYLFPVAAGLIARAFAPELAGSAADAAVLLLPATLLPGPLGEVLGALTVGGAFGAFLATSSGLVVSLAGVLDQEITGGTVRGFRIAAAVSALVPLIVAVLTEPGGIAGSVGLVFAFTASTLCPVLLLGVWWRRLTARGAIAGMLTGGVLCGGAILGGGALASLVPALAPVVQQPALVTVPLAFATAVLVSLADPRGAPRGAEAFLRRLHVPERRAELSPR